MICVTDFYAMTPKRYKRITDVLNHRQTGLTVIADQVHKGRNLAAMVRTCDAVGIDQLHAVIPSEGYQIFNGTAASANNWVDVVYHDNIAAPIDNFKKCGYQIVAASLNSGAIPFRQIDYTIPTAVVFGAEIKGVSQYVNDNVDRNVILPMMGMVESYNVSVACAILLSEVQRQRQEKGMYDSRQISDDLFIKRFYHWAHPDIAAYCDKRGLPYPPLREDGEVANPARWYREVRLKAERK